MTQNKARFHSQLEDDLLRDVERLQLGAPAEHALQHVPEEYELSDHFDGHGLQLGKQPYSRAHPFHKIYGDFMAKGGYAKPSHKLHKQYSDWVAKNDPAYTQKRGKGGGNKGKKKGKSTQRIPRYVKDLEREKPEEYKKKVEEAKEVRKRTVAYLASTLGQSVPDFTEAVNDWNSGVYKLAREELKENPKQAYVNFSEEYSDDASVSSKASTVAGAPHPKKKHFKAMYDAYYALQVTPIPAFIVKAKIYKTDLEDCKRVPMKLLQAHYNDAEKKGAIDSHPGLAKLAQDVKTYAGFFLDEDRKSRPNFVATA